MTPWIIRRRYNRRAKPSEPAFVAEHRASGLQLTVGHRSECPCRDCIPGRGDQAEVERWLRSLPEPPAVLVAAVHSGERAR